MKWKCLFGHDFEEIKRQSIKEYVSERLENSLPISFSTIFLLKCKNCIEMKSITLNGYFSDDNGYFSDDDDDDDNDPPKPPILTPDDFYASL